MVQISDSQIQELIEYTEKLMQNYDKIHPILHNAQLQNLHRKIKGLINK
jgi:hypothetical protein